MLVIVWPLAFKVTFVHRDGSITSSQRISTYPKSNLRYSRLRLARVGFEFAKSIPRNTQSIGGKMRPDEFGTIDPSEATMLFLRRGELIPSRHDQAPLKRPFLLTFTHTIGSPIEPSFFPICVSYSTMTEIPSLPLLPILCGLTGICLVALYNAISHPLFR